MYLLLKRADLLFNVLDQKFVMPFKRSFSSEMVLLAKRLICNDFCQLNNGNVSADKKFVMPFVKSISSEMVLLAKETYL